MLYHTVPHYTVSCHVVLYHLYYINLFPISAQLTISCHFISIPSYTILSHVWDSVTNNNGFWSEWLDLLVLLLQSQSIITAHNQWLPKTRSIPYWTTNVFTSSVTDLVLIYESVTSSASVVPWLTLHNWTLNCLTNAEWRICQECRMIDSRMNSPELNKLPGEPNVDHYLQQFVYYSVLSVVTGMWIWRAVV
jgi:hypothetical protein